MKTVVIIPSRWGSTRFAGKPLARIAGKPMIQHVYERAKKGKNVQEVYVATDDRRISDAVNAFGGKTVMTSAENRSGTDRTAEAADIIGLSPEDIVINVQGDQPLLAPECLDEATAPFFETAAIEMTTLAYKIVEERERIDPKDVKVVMDKEGFALYFSRAAIPFERDAGAIFDTYKHLGVYAYTKRFLDIFRNLPGGVLEDIEKLEQLRALEYGHRIKVIVTVHDSPEVDIPADIHRIEAMLTGKE